MTNIIFVTEKPEEDDQENEQKWKNCIASLSALANKNKDIQLLGENVLLISLDNNLNGLAKAVQAISGLPYKYLILSEEIKWIEATKKV